MSFLARRLTTAAPRLATASRAFSASARRDIAKITIVGNLAATPELKATSTGKEVIEYLVASNDGTKKNEHTSWFRVSSFSNEGPRRDYVTALPKGSTVFVEGDVVLKTYTDSEGKNRTAIKVYQRNLEILRRGTPSEQQSEQHSEEEGEYSG